MSALRQPMKLNCFKKGLDLDGLSLDLSLSLDLDGSSFKL